jgi:hypothetical protein
MTTSNSSYAVLDEALEQIAFAGPDLTNGNSNHAPMAIEALCTLGRADAALPWLEHYRVLLMPRPAGVARIAEADWQSALGGSRRGADWFAFFRNQLDERPWQEVLDRWVARLAPGIVAAALHGVIRAGHAVRALTVGETAQRRRELADGLAYWAAEYQALPGERRAGAGAQPSDAIARLPTIPPAQRGSFDSLTGALTQLDAFAPFHGALAAVDPSRDANAFLGDLTATFARVYVSNARDFLSAIAFVHAVTGPASLRPMLPFLRTETAQAALAYAWQAAAGLYATFSTASAIAPLDVDTKAGAGVLVERAIACGDEHAIKFTAACLAEHALNPQPVFLAAAEQAIPLLCSGA